MGSCLSNIGCQTTLQIHLAISFRLYKSSLVIINIVTDEVVDKFSLIAHSWVFYHRVDDILSFHLIIVACRIEVFYQFQYICYINNITMQQLQTEINIVDICCWVFMRHSFIFFAIVIVLVILIILYESHRHIKIFRAVIIVFLLCHYQR